ncbi:MAG TPA: hypothetical protein VHM27_08650 [Rhizomicrobium sp.]|nr:hypothetical protein [Rhizomicrobium sp.]
MRILIAAALLLATPAFAATPGAWAALDKAARNACERDIARQASKAKVSAVGGRISGIGEAKDSDRYYGLILTGKTAGFASQWLCLYDKRGKTAVAREIEKR